MALTKEQIKTLKDQLGEQIQHLPEDKKAEAQKQIDKMSDEAIETLLQQQQSQQQSQKIFRSIVSGEIPSRKIDENPHAIAVLSVKSISKGHTIIIPKKPVTDEKKLLKSTLTLAKKTAKKISSKLPTKDVQIQPEFLFGEVILHVIPIYDTPLNVNSPRKDASDEELSELEKTLKTIKKPKVIKISSVFKSWIVAKIIQIKATTYKK